MQSALVALGAGAALAGLIALVGELASEAAELSASLTGLSEVAKALDQPLEGVMQAAQDLAARGFMTVQQSAEALKTTLATGFNLDESVNLINALSDAAAFNRQSTYSWGEAVVVATQGIKNQNSELTDAAGITTNLSKMYDRYAASIGTTAAKLTDAQKAQAAYTGMLAESRLFAGNADLAMQSYTGTTAEFEQTVTVARQTLGDAFIPILDELMSKVTPLIIAFTTWAAEHKDVVAGVTAVMVAVTGLITVVTAIIPIIGALKSAFIALQATLGPVGLSLALVGAVTGAVLAYKTAAGLAADSVWQFAQSQDELNRKLAASPLTQTAEDTKKLIADNALLEELTQRRLDLQTRWDEKMSSTTQTTFSDADLKLTREWRKEIQEIDKQLRAMDYDTPEKVADALRDMKEHTEAAVPALMELARQENKLLGEQVAHIKQMETLRDRYNDLNSQEKLNAVQKQELIGVVNTLKGEYPGIRVLIDEENRARITNVEIINDVITAENNSVAVARTAAIEKYKSMRQTTVDLANEAKAQIAILEKVDQAVNSGKKPVYASSFTPSMSAASDSIDALLSPQVTSQLEKNTEAASKYTVAINDIDKALKSLESGNYDAFSLDSLFGDDIPPDEDGKGKKGKTAAELAHEAYRNSVSVLDAGIAMDRVSADQEIAILDGLRKKYAQYADIVQELDVRMYQVRERKDRDAYQNSLNFLNLRVQMNQVTADQEINTLERLKKDYVKYADITDAINLRIYQVRTQRDAAWQKDADAKAAAKKKSAEEAARLAAKVEQDAFNASALWIARQLRLMEDRGASESEIANFTELSWSRVRDRYTKDSDYYERADVAAHSAKMSRIRIETAAQEAAEKARVKAIEETAKKLEDAYEKSVKAALEAGKKALDADLSAVDAKIKQVNKDAETGTAAYRAEIERVNSALKDQIAIYDAQIAALDAADKADDRAEATDAHNKRMKALQDQRMWLALKGAEDNAFDIAAIDKSLAEEQADWSKQLTEWKHDDERDAINALKDAAKERADIRKAELQMQIDALVTWKAAQTESLNAEKERLRTHWDDESEGIRAIMSNGVLDTIADMAAHDAGFKSRGESMIQALIDGIAAKKASLQAEIDAINALVGGASGTSLPPSASLYPPATRFSAEDAIANAAAKTALNSGNNWGGIGSTPINLTVQTLVDSVIVAEKTMPLLGNALRLPIRSGK